MAEANVQTDSDHEPVIVQVQDSRRLVRTQSKKTLGTDIEAVNSTIKDKEQQLSTLSVSSDDGSSLQAALRSIRAQKSEAIAERKSVDVELRTINEQISKQMVALTKVQATLSYRREDRINEGIRRLDFQLKTQNFRLSEEKRIVAEIDSLHRSKKVLGQYLAMKAEIAGLREQQRMKRETKDIQYKKLSRLKGEEDALQRRSFEGRSQTELLKKEIVVLHEQKRFLTTEQRNEEREDEQLREELRQRRRWECARRKEEDQQRVEAAYERDIAEQETRRASYDAEISLCSLLRAYLQRHLAAGGGTAPAAAAALDGSTDSSCSTDFAAISISATAPTPVSAPTPAPDSATTPAPDSATTPAPDSATTPAPVSATPPTSVSATTPTPDSATTPAPDSATTPAPVSATPPTSVSATTPTPDSDTTPTPVSATTSTPLSATTPTPDSATTPTPVSATTPTPLSDTTPTPVSVTTPAPVSDGMYILKRRDEDLFTGVARANNGSRKRNKREKRKQDAVRPLVHTPQIIAQFAQLDLMAPANTADVPSCVEQLDAKQAFYLSMSTTDGPLVTVETDDSAPSLAESAIWCESMPNTPEVALDGHQAAPPFCGRPSAAERRASTDSGTCEDAPADGGATCGGGDEPTAGDGWERTDDETCGDVDPQTRLTTETLSS